MSDSVPSREDDPCSSWPVRDDISGRGSNTLKPKHLLLCTEMFPGLVSSESLSNSSSLKTRESSNSETDGFGDDVRSPSEQDNVGSCAEGQHGPSPERQREEQLACQPPGVITQFNPISETILNPKKRKLVLHIDLNNTILVSDAVTNQDPRAALNYYLTTVTWGKISPAGEWHWLSDSPSLLPPCNGAVSFYSQYGRNTTFTDTAMGRRFRDLHRHHLQLLEWQGQPHPSLSVQGEQAKRYHLVLPSFFRLLEWLHQEGRQFAIILRTFGTDLPRVLQAVGCALEGQHPHFPALAHISLSVDPHPGTIRCSKRKVVLTYRKEKISTEDGGRKMYAYFSSREGICGFQDHFDWWARNQFSIRGGKPLWIDPHDASVHHICIDDNIRLNDSDTIVQPQVFSGQASCSVRMPPTSELYGTCLVQTDLLGAIADVNYFCRCIKQCEENYESYLARAGD
ncbi:hypothetical protein JRQ81_003302 [Phrynocephalus forsythii]|uniref:Uncharacterized protein n=1 Tax=Phrynocephalus forsythii TaxID=171643 RepID=A0A9Q0XLG4_9SAUR|nr:hypothetical protein JRQ81_003302 [Phrynocephalus forsythii]